MPGLADDRSLEKKPDRANTKQSLKRASTLFSTDNKELALKLLHNFERLCVPSARVVRRLNSLLFALLTLRQTGASAPKNVN